MNYDMELFCAPLATVLVFVGFYSLSGFSCDDLQLDDSFADLSSVTPPPPSAEMRSSSLSVTASPTSESSSPTFSIVSYESDVD